MAQWKGGVVTPKTAHVPQPRRAVGGAVRSVTREEIDDFWRRRKMVEEDHLLAAQKAAARLRAKALKEEDYMRFEELLRQIMDGGGESRKGGGVGDKIKNKEEEEEEVRIGIKDWWTGSSYAYLNQPAIRSMGESSLRLTGTYVPQRICASFCSPAPCQFRTTYFSVF